MYLRHKIDFGVADVPFRITLKPHADQKSNASQKLQNITEVYYLKLLLN